MILSENASRHGHHFAQQRLGFCVALESKKGRRRKLLAALMVVKFSSPWSFKHPE